MTTTAIRLSHPGHPEAIDVVAHDEARTLVEVELAPGGGNPLHVHRTYAEHFEVLEGRLGLQVSGATQHLVAGERITAPAGIAHRFFNDGDRSVRFRVELRPGHAGFVAFQTTLFALMADGRTSARGVPRDPRHLAVLFSGADILPAGRAQRWAFAAFAAAARLSGEDRRLRQRYPAPHLG